MKIAQSQSYSNNLNFRANLVYGGNNNDHLKDFAQNPKKAQIDLIEKTGDKIPICGFRTGQAEAISQL